MQNKIGKGLSLSNKNSLLLEDDGVADFAYTVEIKFSYPADFYWSAAEAYLEMFGLLRTDKVLRSWSLFVMQYNSKRTENGMLETANYFRIQEYFQEQARIPNVNHYTLKIDVPQSFIDRLSDFGIEVSFNPVVKKVTVTKFEPISMIAWSDLLVGDIVLVDGNSYLSSAIKIVTSSQYSHAAIYDGSGSVYEAIGKGVVSTSLDIAIKQLKIVAVLRPKNYNLAAAHMAVNYARAATNELGGRQKKYDVPGALSSAVSWKTAIVITPLLPLKIAPAATDAIFGSDASFF